jgi:hypothetical protein
LMMVATDPERLLQCENLLHRPAGNEIYTSNITRTVVNKLHNRERYVEN